MIKLNDSLEREISSDKKTQNKLRSHLNTLEPNTKKNKSPEKKFKIKLELKNKVHRILSFTSRKNPCIIAQNFCFENCLDDFYVDLIANFISIFLKESNLPNFVWEDKIYMLRDLRRPNFN